MVTRTVAAYQLRAGWIVLPENGQPRRISLARSQGAPPHVVVHWIGRQERTTYSATAAVIVELDQ